MALPAATAVMAAQRDRRRRAASRAGAARHARAVRHACCCAAPRPHGRSPCAWSSDVGDDRPDRANAPRDRARRAPPHAASAMPHRLAREPAQEGAAGPAAAGGVRRPRWRGCRPTRAAAGARRARCRVVEPAVQGLGAVDQVLQALVDQVLGREPDPFLLVVAVALRYLRSRCSIWAGWIVSACAVSAGSARSPQCIDAGPHVGFERASLLRRSRSPGARRSSRCSSSAIPRQFVRAVPGVQAREVVAHRGALRVVEIDVAVEPPVAQFGQVVVAQLDRAAAAQRHGKTEQADNPRQAQGCATHPDRRK